MQKTSLSSKMASSQKRKFLTLEEKVQLIRYKDENNAAGVRQITEMFGIGKTQASCIMKSKEQVMQLWKSNSCPDMRRKKRPAEFEQINKAVSDWFCMARGSNIPISGPMIQEEAKEIANRLQIDDFKASNGWLQK